MPTAAFNENTNVIKNSIKTMSSQYNFHNLVNNKTTSKTSKLYIPRKNLLYTNNYSHSKNKESSVPVKRNFVKYFLDCIVQIT